MRSRRECNDIRWAGFYASDQERFGLSAQCEIRLSAEDVEAAQLLIHHPSKAHVNEGLRRELELMVERGQKIELDSLFHVRPDFLTREYLPRKLFESELVHL